MSDIFTYETQDIDLKECTKLKINCEQLDTMVLQFNVLNYDIPVDLTNYDIEFRAKKPDGTFYSQTDNITKSSSLVTITCNNQLTSVTGKVSGLLRICNSSESQKSSYFIVLNVFGLLDDDQKVISKNFVDVSEHLDSSINLSMKLVKSFDSDIQSFSTIINELITNANNTKYALDITNNDAKTTQSSLNNANTQAKNNIDALNKLGDVTNLALEVYTARDGEDNLNNRLERDKTFTNLQISQILKLIDMLFAGTNIVNESGNILTTDTGSLLSI